MVLKSKKSYLIATTLILGVLVLTNIFVIGSAYHELFSKINRPLFEPLLIWSAALFACAIILMFFSNQVFEKWAQKVLVWSLPLGLLVTFVTDPSVSYVLPNRLGVAMMFGQLLVLVTLVFALVQKFKYKL